MSRLFRLGGYALCVLPPAVATLEHFPVWLREGDTALSGIALLLLLAAALPLLRTLRAHLRTPSAWMVWLALWLALRLICPILDTVARIALISFPTSLLGALLFRLGARRDANRN